MNKFSQPKGRSSALDAVQTSNADALEVPFKSLKVGEGIVVRMLSLSSDEGHIVIQPGVRASIENTKPNAPEPYFKSLVPLPKNPDDAEKILDDEGMALSDGDLKESWFIPVFMLYTTDADGFIVDEINELRYLRAGPGMVKDLKTLSENVKDDFEFDAIPPYDIRIEAFKNGNIPNWSLHPVTKILSKDGKKIVKDTCPRFGVDELSDALGKETWDYVVDNIGELIEHFTSVDEKERKVENVKKRFVRYRNPSNGDGAKNTRSTGMKRDLPVNEPDDVDETEDTETTEEESKPTFRGLGGKSPGKGRFGK